MAGFDQSKDAPTDRPKGWGSMSQPRRVDKAGDVVSADAGTVGSNVVGTVAPITSAPPSNVPTDAASAIASFADPLPKADAVTPPRPTVGSVFQSITAAIATLDAGRKTVDELFSRFDAVRFGGDVYVADTAAPGRFRKARVADETMVIGG